MNRNGAVKRPNPLLEENYYQFKLVLLGKSDVGKSALLTRLMYNDFLLKPGEATIGATFHTHTMSFDGNTVKLDSKYKEMKFLIIPYIYFEY